MKMQQCHSALMFFTIISVLLCSSSNANITPKSVAPCKNTSQECLRSAIQTAIPGFISGIPEMGIEPLDPFVINKLELMLPGGLVMEFRQGISKGLRKCTVDFARMKNNNLEVQFRCNLTIKGKYKSSGRMLMFSIDGDGDSLIKCKNIKIQCLLKLGSIVENGKKYLEIKNFKSRHHFDGQVFYRLSNLIKGNPQISHMVLDFMNRNWRLVADEFGKPIVDFGVTSVLENIKKLLKNVPLDQLLSEPHNF